MSDLSSIRDLIIKRRGQQTKAWQKHYIDTQHEQEGIKFQVKRERQTFEAKLDADFKPIDVIARERRAKAILERELSSYVDSATQDRVDLEALNRILRVTETIRDIAPEDEMAIAQALNEFPISNLINSSLENIIRATEIADGILTNLLDKGIRLKDKSLSLPSLSKELTKEQLLEIANNLGMVGVSNLNKQQLKNKIEDEINFKEASQIPGTPVLGQQEPINSLNNILRTPNTPITTRETPNASEQQEFKNLIPQIPSDLTKLKVIELKDIARQLKIKGFSTLNKEQLIKAIQEKQEETKTDTDEQEQAQPTGDGISSQIRKQIAQHIRDFNRKLDKIV